MALNKQPYKGTRDLFPKAKRKLDYIFETMKKTAHEFAYESYDGPLLEEIDLYRAKSGEELINEQIYSFMDRGEREVAIRPEMTPTVARMVSQVHREIAKPIRWFSIPNLMRYEKPQKGRLREHWQFNVDIFGAPGILGEFEIIQVVVKLFNNFGADDSHFGISLNDRRFVDQVFGNLLKLDESKSLKLYKVVDRSKKVTTEALAKMTAEILNESEAKIFQEYLSLKSFEDIFKFSDKYKISDNLTDFKNFYEKLKNLNLLSYVEYDPTIVRGLDYYTGIVFEAFDKHPDNRRALCGGGAYANLLKIFNEPALPGVGFGLGDVTLTDFLEVHNLFPNLEFAANDIFVTYQTELAEDLSLNFAMKLREHGLKVEIHFGAVKPKKVFELAQKKGHQFVSLVGDDELNLKSIQIKNQTTRESKVFPMDDIMLIVEFLQNK